MTRNKSMIVPVLAAAIFALACVANAASVVNFPVETSGSEWWPCGWVSSSGDVWAFYQADRDSDGRNIMGVKMSGTVAGSEVTIINGTDSHSYQEPVIRGTAGYLASRRDSDSVVSVVDLNNSNAIVYETAGATYEPRIYDKTLIYGTNNAIWMVPDVTSPVDPVQIAAGDGWMGHPDIDGDYVSYQWWDGTQNNAYLYQISTGMTTMLTTNDDNGCGNPHVGGGYVAWQNWGNGNRIYLYNIATGTRTLAYTGGYFNDTVPGPVVNDKYLIFTIDSSTPGNDADIMAYDIAAGTVFPVAAFWKNDWGATIAGNWVFHGKWTGSLDTIWGAEIVPEPSCVLVLMSALGGLAAVVRRKRVI